MNGSATSKMGPHLKTMDHAVAAVGAETHAFQTFRMDTCQKPRVWWQARAKHRSARLRLTMGSAERRQASHEEREGGPLVGELGVVD